MITKSELLEAIAEALRSKRRWSYTREFDLSLIQIADDRYINIELPTEDGIKKFKLLLVEDNEEMPAL